MQSQKGTADKLRRMPARRVRRGRLLNNVFTDKRDTSALVPLIQAEISRRIAGARVDVRQLETGPPIEARVSLHIIGPDVERLRMLSAQLQSILRAIPSATRIRDDWGENRIALNLKVDPDRAAINAVTNQDVAQSSMMNTSGLTVGTFYDQDKIASAQRSLVV
jgi:multidrug efflux pump subunit AcrB